jgi:hypothetical protein
VWIFAALDFLRELIEKIQEAAAAADAAIFSSSHDQGSNSCFPAISASLAH